MKRFMKGLAGYFNEWFGMWEYSKGAFIAILIIKLAMVGLIILGAVMIPRIVEYESKCHEAGGIMVKNTCMAPSSVLQFRN